MRVPASTRFRQHWLRRPLRAISSWRGRILLTTVCLALMPAIAVIVAIAFGQSRDSLQVRTQQLLNAAAIAAAALDREIDDHLRMATDLAAGLAEVGLAEQAVLETQVVRAAQSLPTLESVGVAEAAGRIVAMSGRAERDDASETASFVGQSIADRDFFKVPLASAQNFVSNVVDANQRRPTLAISAPIFQGGRVTGVVFAQKLASSLAALEQLNSQSLDTRIVVLDRQKRVIYASDHLRISPLSSVGDAPWLAASFATGAPDSARVYELAASASPFDGAGAQIALHVTSRGWYVLLVREQLTTSTVVWQFLKSAAPILLLASLVAVLLAYRLSVAIMRPLSQVLQRVESFSMDGSQSHFRRIGPLPLEYLRMVRRLHRMAWRLSAWQHRLREALADAKRARSEIINVLVTREDEVRVRTRELAEANAALERLSRVDPLTGIANRRWFAEALDREWRACLRDRKQITVLFVDVDHYKSYNDKYGHQAGDEVLVKVAQALQTSLYRPHDLLARYGGEEFAAVVTGASVADAMRLGERLRAAVEALGVLHEGSKARGILTASVGVTTVTPDPTMSAEWLLRLADQALYAAKDGGRNVVFMMGTDGLVHTCDALPSEHGSGIHETSASVTPRVPALEV